MTTRKVSDTKHEKVVTKMGRNTVAIMQPKASAKVFVTVNPKRRDAVSRMQTWLKQLLQQHGTINVAASSAAKRAQELQLKLQSIPTPPPQYSILEPRVTQLEQLLGARSALATQCDSITTILTEIEAQQAQLKQQFQAAYESRQIGSQQVGDLMEQLRNVQGKLVNARNAANRQGQVQVQTQLQAQARADESYRQGMAQGQMQGMAQGQMMQRSVNPSPVNPYPVPQIAEGQQRANELTAQLVAIRSEAGQYDQILQSVQMQQKQLQADKLAAESRATQLQVVVDQLRNQLAAAVSGSHIVADRIVQSQSGMDSRGAIAAELLASRHQYQVSRAKAAAMEAYATRAQEALATYQGRTAQAEGILAKRNSQLARLYDAALEQNADSKTLQLDRENARRQLKATQLAMARQDKAHAEYFRQLEDAHARDLQRIESRPKQTNAQALLLDLTKEKEKSEAIQVHTLQLMNRLKIALARAKTDIKTAGDVKALDNKRIRELENEMDRAATSRQTLIGEKSKLQAEVARLQDAPNLMKAEMQGELAALQRNVSIRDSRIAQNSKVIRMYQEKIRSRQNSVPVPVVHTQHPPSQHPSVAASRSESESSLPSIAATRSNRQSRHYQRPGTIVQSAPTAATQRSRSQRRRSRSRSKPVTQSMTVDRASRLIQQAQSQQSQRAQSQQAQSQQSQQAQSRQSQRAQSQQSQRAQSQVQSQRQSRRSRSRSRRQPPLVSQTGSAASIIRVPRFVAPQQLIPNQISQMSRKVSRLQSSQRLQTPSLGSKRKRRRRSLSA